MYLYIKKKVSQISLDQTLSGIIRINQVKHGRVKHHFQVLELLVFILYGIMPEMFRSSLKALSMLLSHHLLLKVTQPAVSH